MMPMLLRPRRPDTKGGVIPLADVDKRHRWVDVVLGFVNRVILVVLALASLVLVLFAVSPAVFANAVTSRSGPLLTSQRLSFIAGALITGATCALLNNRLISTWAWARLPYEGSLKVGKEGLSLKHEAVLDREITIPWDNVRAITLDSGLRHDTRLSWRRFPLPAAGHEHRSYLFANDGAKRPEFALIAARPVAPNIAILLKSPIALHNPNANLTGVTFPKRGLGVPVQPPAVKSVATGLLLRARDLHQTRQMLLPSGKIRALRIDDVPGLN